MNVPTSKSITANIVISEPDEALLEKSLQGRDIPPELRKFLRNLVKTKKWTRKITLPSSHDDVAVALVFTSSLKETGLEIVTELHVFYNNKIIIEEWQVVGESEETSAFPKEAFSSMSIRRVLVKENTVHVELIAPLPGGKLKIFGKNFDFDSEEPSQRSVPHPLLDAAPVE